MNQWILSLVEVPSFERLTENMKASEMEGFDGDNVSRYYRFLRAQLFDRAELPFDVLLGYDQNIVRHWLSIAERRNRQGQALYPKYFQYLSLLFAEIYLDRYFRNPEGLLEALNRQVEAFNTGKPQRDQVQPYQRTDLNKLAFWSATGSGKALEQEYARCILFDYSYKYFYHDGYGKDYRILNLEEDSDEAVRRRYLTACLLAFYQQLKLFNEKQIEFRPFLIERPLWIFVGPSVNAVRTQHGRKVSDVVDILLFLAEFVSRRAETVDYLDRFLQGRSGLLDAQGNDLFARAFTYLYKQQLTGEQVYHDILRVLFNAASPAALHLENLKGAEGEIALRLGDNDLFGLINPTTIFIQFCSHFFFLCER